MRADLRVVYVRCSGRFQRAARAPKQPGEPGLLAWPSQEERGPASCLRWKLPGIWSLDHLRADGTPAGYYFAPATTASSANEWLVFLEGPEQGPLCVFGPPAALPG